MVRWLKANAASTGQATLISDATFMALMDDLNSGVFTDSGDISADTCMSELK